jgi:hypothetical protein
MMTTTQIEVSALVPSSAIPCPLMQQQQQGQCGQMVAEWTMVPWHCWPFLPSCTMATTVAAQMNGGGAEDCAMAALLAVPCPLA